MGQVFGFVLWARPSFILAGLLAGQSRVCRQHPLLSPLQMQTFAASWTPSKSHRRRVQDGISKDNKACVGAAFDVSLLRVELRKLIAQEKKSEQARAKMLTANNQLFQPLPSVCCFQTCGCKQVLKPFAGCWWSGRGWRWRWRPGYGLWSSKLPCPLERPPKKM